MLTSRSIRTKRDAILIVSKTGIIGTVNLNVSQLLEFMEE
jgi:hypothetical protein